jgi:hypothetical protein
MRKTVKTSSKIEPPSSRLGPPDEEDHAVKTSSKIEPPSSR